MRTTLDIDDDVLFAAKAIAQREKKSLGQVVTDLARRAFATPPASPGLSTGTTGTTAPLVASERLASYGITPLPARGGIVSNELIDRLRDAEGI
jgi:hypothetical protein